MSTDTHSKRWRLSLILERLRPSDAHLMRRLFPASAAPQHPRQDTFSCSPHRSYRSTFGSCQTAAHTPRAAPLTRSWTRRGRHAASEATERNHLSPLRVELAKRLGEKHAALLPTSNSQYAGQSVDSNYYAHHTEVSQKLSTR
eukprot:1159454-Pelagomonas_calceolata.AAC.5